MFCWVECHGDDNDLSFKFKLQSFFNPGESWRFTLICDDDAAGSERSLWITKQICCKNTEKVWKTSRETEHRKQCWQTFRNNIKARMCRFSHFQLRASQPQEHQRQKSNYSTKTKIWGIKLTSTIKLSHESEHMGSMSNCTLSIPTCVCHFKHLAKMPSFFFFFNVPESNLRIKA